MGAHTFFFLDFLINSLNLGQKSINFANLFQRVDYWLCLIIDIALFIYFVFILLPNFFRNLITLLFSLRIKASVGKCPENLKYPINISLINSNKLNQLIERKLITILVLTTNKFEITYL